MSILRRELAPVVDAAWKEIEEVAARRLELNLSGRRLVDLSGPFGWEHGAVNLGRLDVNNKKKPAGVSWGLRRVQPLVELRVPFTLDLMELDCSVRGARDIDLDPVAEAAEAVARFEDGAIFNGLSDAGIQGILRATPHKVVSAGTSNDYAGCVVEASEVLRDAGVNGPYALALGTSAFKEVVRATQGGYPVRRQIERQILDGPIVHAPCLEGGVLVSTRGGDYELTIGQDLSIGYATHDKERVELYLTESFTFRVLEPAAAVPVKMGKK